MKGETTVERVGYRSYRWEDERSLHLNGHVAVGITHGVGYVEAFHDSAIGQDDAGTDGVRIGVRWEWD
jgi:beta-galactosidase/beta-glucuronidase